MSEPTSPPRPDGEHKVIYDLGANTGCNLAYYLMKADLVVAVEANPTLADAIKAQFADEIASGRLAVENCVLTVDDHGGGEVDFYISKKHHVLSQFPLPADPENFTRVSLPSKRLADIIATHGEPFFVKIDIEHYDEAILRSLFSAGIRPPYISAEAHNVAVFAQLVANGGYTAFKLVDGPTVGTKFASHSVSTPEGRRVVHFTAHSAGPFGDDLPGEWDSGEAFLQRLALRGFGWKDIHATNLHAPTMTGQPTARQALGALAWQMMKAAGRLAPLGLRQSIKRRFV